MSSLFPESPPDPIAEEPPIWIRRLVIIRSLDPQPDVIRDIPFELGLNLIVTRQPEDGSNESLGHDVGKTLLTRIIRYLLGEAQFADSRTRSAIRQRLPDSFVAGEFSVRGQHWAVLLPLGAPPTCPPRVAEEDSWRDLLAHSGSSEPYQRFVQEVGDAVLEPVSSPALTHARRPIEWLDVLGWISRDQRCRYSHPLEWRHADSESGTRRLHIEDASTVLRSVCGLMNDREKILFEEHDELLRRRQAADQDVKQIHRQHDVERESLERDLCDLLNSTEIGVSEIELQVLRTRTSGLQAVRTEEVAKLGLPELRSELAQAQQRLAVAREEDRKLEGQLEATRRHLARCTERTQSPYEALAELCDTPPDDCPLKLKIAHEQVPTPPKSDIEELNEEVRAAEARRSEVRASLDDLSEAVLRHKQAVLDAESRLSTLTSGIDGKIALYESMISRTERFLQRPSDLAVKQAGLDELDSRISASQKQQAELRDSLALSREWLSDRFSDLCADLLGGLRKFRLAIESKAIRLEIMGSTGTPGEATSTSALVLCLDLAALRAAVDGYGSHPRFMILDSPREADMEIGIFNRLIETLLKWHSSNAASAFQLIMTTTTRPVEDDNARSVTRAELARSPESALLLGVEL